MSPSARALDVHMSQQCVAFAYDWFRLELSRYGVAQGIFTLYFCIMYVS
jgi:hypothetical protein